MSCLLEAGRYDKLIALLALKKTSLWFDMKLGAQALLRHGREDEALAFAEALLKDDGRLWGYQDIARFCEGILVRQGREEDAYRRFGLPTASGTEAKILEFPFIQIWADDLPDVLYVVPN